MSLFSGLPANPSRAEFAAALAQMGVQIISTGGTMKACVDLVKQLDGHLAGIAVLIELTALDGRKRIAPHAVHSVIQY